jgi:hypothetical protein
MRIFIKIITALLLLFNAIGALYGGYQLIRNPDGSSMQLSPDLLTHTWFSSYAIPGMILFIGNGLLSLYALAALLFMSKHHGLVIMLQGIILTGWILIQLLLIQTLSYWQLLLGLIGLSLIISGIVFRNWQQESDSDKSLGDDRKVL